MYTSLPKFFNRYLSASLACALFSLIGIKASGQARAPVVYPRIAGHVGIVHPLVSFNRSGTTTNFNGSYTVGMPLGVNIWKNSKIGFSFETVPYIHAENGTSKMSNLLIHPGVLVSLGNGFTFAGRAAFETSGRYGFTPVFSKVVKRSSGSNYFVAFPLPVRFGNAKNTSAAIAFQFGIGF